MSDDQPDASDAIVNPPEAPKPAPPPNRAPPPAAPARRQGWGAAVAVAIIAAVLVLAAPFWAPPLLPLLPWGRAPDRSADVKALAARLDAAEAAQRANDARTAQLLSQTSQLAAQAQQQAGRIDALEHRDPDAAVAALKDQVTQLSARLDDAAKRAAAPPADGMLLVSLGELRAALGSGAPFGGTLAASRALGRNDADVSAALDALAPAAATGVPTTTLLAERFETETAPAILRADAATTAPGDDSFLARLLARVRTLVVIHRVDGAGGDATEAAVAKAQASLRQDDLAGAVAALKALDGAPAQAAAPWLASAGQRLAAQDALDKLMQQVAGRLAAAAPPAAAAAWPPAPVPAPAGAPAPAPARTPRMRA